MSIAGVRYGMEQKSFRENTFAAGNKTITVFPSVGLNRPIIYLNTFAVEGSRVYQALRNTGDFTLVVISGLDWNHDMSPWAIPPISNREPPCTGGADNYLQLLTEEIIPGAERYVQGGTVWRGLAGYSLAGLLAVYSMYHTDRFSKIASISGSLWFPGLLEYATSHEMKKKPEHLYLSLGDKECKTRNPYLKTVQDNTEKLAAFYREQQIDAAFHLNPGNHYKEALERTTAGITWLLNR